MTILKKDKLFILITIIVFILILKFSPLLRNTLAYYSTANSINSDMTVTDVIGYTPSSCFGYIKTSNSVTIKSYDVETCGTDVIMPKRIEGLPVTIIGDRAFDRNYITSLILNDNLEIIGEYAFSRNKIESLEIPSSIKEIGHGAFFVGSIKKLILHEGLEIIGDNSFNGNQISGELKLPTSLKQIENGAFVSNKINGTLIIPKNVIAIGASAFRKNQISNLILNEGLKTIDYLAFADNKFTSVEIPSTVIDLSAGAFNNNVNIIRK